MGWIAGGIAVAGLAGAVISSSSASSAADTQAAAANNASAASQAQVAQTRADLSPFRASGLNALGQLQAILSSGAGLTFQPTQAQLESTPGYKFDLAQGLQGVANSNAAQGRGISGAALKGAAAYATGLANNTLGTQQSIFQTNLGNVMNPLEYLANQGENAAATTGQQGIAATNASNAALIGGANAQAAGIVGSGNALAGGLNSVGSAPLNYMLYNQLLGNGTTNAQFSSAVSNSPFMGSDGVLASYPF